jgi:hypothetical protein
MSFSFPLHYVLHYKPSYLSIVFIVHAPCSHKLSLQIKKSTILSIHPWPNKAVCLLLRLVLRPFHSNAILQGFTFLVAHSTRNLSTPLHPPISSPKLEDIVHTWLGTLVHL